MNVDILISLASQ